MNGPYFAEGEINFLKDDSNDLVVGSYLGRLKLNINS